MKKSLLLTLFLILLVLGYLYYYFTHVMPKDIQNYEEYLKKKKSDCTSLKSNHPKIQWRQGVQKSIWCQKDNERLLYHITADHSTLKMIPLDGGWHLEEVLYDFNCFMQEPSDGKTCKVKHLKAKEGVYDYDDHLFIAEKVFINFYEATKTLPFLIKENTLQSNLLKGVADKVALRLNDRMVSFQADKFRAEISKDEESL